MKNYCAGMYYGSYSLPTYVTIWNGEAFVLTTVIPVLMMMVLTWMILRRKLKLIAAAVSAQRFAAQTSEKAALAAG